MIKRFADFLSGVKMTYVSAICLLTGIVFMFYDVTFIFNPIWLTIIISGLPIAYTAIIKLFFHHCISSSLLITVAMTAAISIGESFAAAEVALIMAIGEILEDITVDRAKRGLGRLLQLTPSIGHKIFADGHDETIYLSDIHSGDILRVLPGENIPVDGVIICGSTAINQAMLTGEPLAVDKSIGDKVMAGTINCFGTIEIRAQNIKDTYLQKMINLVKNAESQKAPVQKIIDKWASVLVPTALLLAIVTYLITGEIVRSVTVLVVFCPCALVLATPTSVMAAIGNATKKGVLVKSGAALEEMQRINTVIFDKTGTLSTGEICVEKIVSFNKKFKRRQILEITSSLEKYSEHTLAQAVIRTAVEEEVTFSAVKDFAMYPGKGIRGIIGNMSVIAGNINFIKENNIVLSSTQSRLINQEQQQGKALILTAIDGQIAGVIFLADELRPASKNVIQELEYRGIECLMLTGDNRPAALYYSKLLHLNKFKADLLPNDKANEIKRLRSLGKSVCMVGDGINDAAALKTADVGIAMAGIGSDIAVDSADIVLLNSNIESIPYVYRLSKRTVQTIKFNLCLSMGLNLLGIVLSVYGLLTPAAGAVMHNLGVVLIVLNAAKLYDTKL